MKQNPFLFVLAAVGVLGTVIGIVLSLVEGQGTVSAEGVGVLGTMLLTLGAPAIVGALVLAGVEWRHRQDLG